MFRPRVARRLLLPLVLLLWDAAGAVETATPGASPPATPAPGDTHAASILKRFAGVWNATMQIASPDDSPPQVLNGIEVVTVGGGGAWVVSDFHSQLEGRPFQGHAILARNAATGRYRRVWADATSPTFWLSEGDWDAAKQTLTLWIETVNSAGRPVRWREEMVFNPDDSRTFTMYVPGAGTADAAAITIDYRRRGEGEPRQAYQPASSPPSPGHALLWRDAGTWSAQMETRKGSAVESSKGTETNTICCHGYFLVTDYSGGTKKAPFAGHGLLGFDPARRKYVSAWVDTADTALEIHEGDYDPATEAMTFKFAAGSHGTTTAMREVLEWKGTDRRILTLYSRGAGGAEVADMTIRYKRATGDTPPARK
jgi:uncharacterized protein DUF1579